MEMLLMQIRKVYEKINPQLLYDEVKDLVQKHGAIANEAKLVNYSVPNDSSAYVSRGILIFNTTNDNNKPGKECLRVYIVGSQKREVKLILDFDESLFTQKMADALKSDLDFLFSQSDKKRRNIRETFFHSDLF